jgi:hypothetical protein
MYVRGVLTMDVEKFKVVLTSFSVNVPQNGVW